MVTSWPAAIAGHRATASTSTGSNPLARRAAMVLSQPQRGHGALETGAAACGRVMQPAGAPAVESNHFYDVRWTRQTEGHATKIHGDADLKRATRRAVSAT